MYYQIQRDSDLNFVLNFSKEEIFLVSLALVDRKVKLANSSRRSEILRLYL